MESRRHWAFFSNDALLNPPANSSTFTPWKQSKIQHIRLIQSHTMAMKMRFRCCLLVLLVLMPIVAAAAGAGEQGRSLKDDLWDDEPSTDVPSMDSSLEELEEEIVEEILEESSMTPSAEESVLEGLGLGDELGEEFAFGEGEDAEEPPEENVVDEVSMQEFMAEEEENALETTEEEELESSTAIEVSETAESTTPASGNNSTTLDLEVDVIEEELDSETETEMTQLEESESGTAEESEPTETPEYGDTEDNPNDATEGPENPYQGTATTTTTTSSTYDTSAYKPVTVEKEDVEYLPPSGDPLDEKKEKEEDIANQWHKEDWTNKTPQELAAFAEEEADKMLHDKYVPLVAVAVAVVCFAFMFFVVQQLVENPNGCLSKTCKCTVAFFRIISWPIRMILCCGLCCGSRARQPDHQLLGDSEHMSKNGGNFSDDDLEFV